jgi:hypothetical protein
MPPKKQTFALVPIPKESHLSQSFKKYLLWKGVELPHPPPPHRKKNPFEKEKKVPSMSSSFLIASFTTCNYFNLIELSTPYTH